MENKYIKYQNESYGDPKTTKLMMDHLAKSDDYYTWLNQFSKEVDVIWTTHVKLLDHNNQNRSKIIFIKILFDLVSKYAQDKNITPYDTRGGISYLFSCLGVKYLIGCSPVCDNPNYYCKRLNGNTKGNFIDLYQIREHEGLYNNVASMICDLRKIVNALLENNLTEDEILKVVKEETKEVKTKKIGTLK